MAEERRDSSKLCVPTGISPACAVCRAPPVDPYKKTSDLYSTCNLPARFDCPEWFHGYGCQINKQHPLYRTTSNDYGWFPPGYYSVPTTYFPMGQKFTNHLAGAGMYRNYSLNTGMDKYSSF